VSDRVAAEVIRTVLSMSAGTIVDETREYGTSDDEVRRAMRAIDD